MQKRLDLRVGELVEVKSKEEILETLDRNGHLDGLPFMPQMFRYCGLKFRVFKSAHKTCDTVRRPAGLKMENAVHLEELRCDGSNYGGCAAECLIFWKEAWLKRVEGKQSFAKPETSSKRQGNGCTEQDVVSAAVRGISEGDPVYACQATELPKATSNLPWWDIRQYVRDVISRNASPRDIVRGAFYFAYYRISQAGIGLGPAMRWFYDRFQSWSGGVPFPRRTGIIPAGKPTPTGSLGLKPGDLVRIKSYEQILATLDSASKNRGLVFDAEAVPYCGGTYKVRRVVDRIIDEKTGKLIKMKTPSVTLDGVFCKGCYSSQRLLCPRALLSFWREIWLEKVVGAPAYAETASGSQVSSDQKVLVQK